MPTSSPASRRLPGFILATGVILIGANLRAPITSLGPVLPDIQARLGLDGTAAGLLNALPLLLFAALSLIAPRLGRRFGLGRVLGVSIAAIVLGTLVRSIWLPEGLWLGTIVLSCGIALGNVLLPGLVKRDFPECASSLIGLYAAAMAGMAGLSAGLAVPIAHLPFADWRWSLGVWAALSLLTLLIWLPTMRNGSADRVSGTTQAKGAGSVWRHPVAWQVSLFFAFHSLVFYSLVDWLASYVADIGVNPATAGGYLLVYQVVAVATNLGSASLIRRLRDQTWLGLACGLCLLVATGGLLVAPDLALVWVVAGGLGAGIAMVTSLSLFALRTRDHHQAGALSGMAQFIGYAGAAAGPLLIGVLRDATGTWTAPFALLIVASLLVALFATLAGRDKLI
ncbi:MFS transporter [Novosphingobium profundi]|uniref:MFS transporter n=1 Tax=Novosphingobium profundi TaxID=1774954 RepID=UPI001BDB22DA|nr:MFS transporter [Novosphingobium profundi]MBT0667359.1 MFS transporter [Novosphingobium profundi]